MRDRVLRKALVIGIIVLFLGVGFQPVLANEISDGDEDCLDCQPASRVDFLKVKLLLIRLKAITNVILSRLERLPEIKEKCEELLIIIDSLDLKDLLCEILMYIWGPLFAIMYALGEAGRTILASLVLIPFTIFYFIWQENCFH